MWEFLICFTPCCIHRLAQKYQYTLHLCISETDSKFAQAKDMIKEKESIPPSQYPRPQPSHLPSTPQLSSYSSHSDSRQTLHAPQMPSLRSSSRTLPSRCSSSLHPSSPQVGDRVWCARRRLRRWRDGVLGGACRASPCLHLKARRSRSDGGRWGLGVMCVQYGETAGSWGCSLEGRWGIRWGFGDVPGAIVYAR